MSLNEWLVTFAFLLIMLDFFVASDVLTLKAHAIFAYVLVDNFDVHYLYKIMIGIMFWFMVMALHFLVWKRVISYVLDNFIARDVYVVGADGMSGEQGRVRVVDGEKMAMVRDDLYNFKEMNDLADGDCFIVAEVVDGMIDVRSAETL